MFWRKVAALGLVAELLCFGPAAAAQDCPKALSRDQVDTPSASDSRVLYQELLAVLNAEDSFPSRAPRPAGVPSPLVSLGRMLFFDKVLSGNRDISCATCHHPHTFTGDERLLGFGTGAGNKASEQCNGGSNIGTDRHGRPDTMIARHAPPLYNLHLFDTMFWDSRIEKVDVDGDLLKESISTPAGVMTPSGQEPLDAFMSVFDFGVVSAQPLFPLLDRSEMRGKLNSLSGDHQKFNSSVDGFVSGSCENWNDEYNELADAVVVDDNNALIPAAAQQLWGRIIDRLRCEAPAYEAKFAKAYNDVSRWEDVSIAHLANAIAGYMIDEFEAVDSEWDAFLMHVEQGDDAAARKQLNPSQMKGAKIFFEKGCDVCHSGPAFSDFKHHNTGLRQLGPGKLNHGSAQAVEGVNGVTEIWDDLGRWGVTNRDEDKHAFRTQPLLNVSETWTRGHAGQFLRLDDFINHYRIPVQSYTSYESCFDNYNFAASGSPIYQMFYGDGSILDDTILGLSSDVLTMQLSEEDVFFLGQFLRALTDTRICNEYKQPGVAYQGQAELRDEKGNVVTDQNGDHIVITQYEYSNVTSPPVKSGSGIDAHDWAGCLATPNPECQGNGGN